MGPLLPIVVTVVRGVEVRVNEFTLVSACPLPHSTLLAFEAR
jgi:hypothetical protein